MINPEVFLLAAQLLGDGSTFGCCFAIHNAHMLITPGIEDDLDSSEAALFSELFPWQDGEQIKEWGYRHNTTEEQVEARMLALLFCYWEAKWRNK